MLSSTTNSTLCIAHRGARDEAPDNTSAAFESALKYPIDGIELDVQMSADGVPVLFHDSTLRRVGGGQNSIADLTFSQLQSLNWGGWFHPDFAPEPLMTLEGLIPLVRRCPRLFIEIKSHPREQLSGHAYHLTKKAITCLLQKADQAWQERMYILSFDAKVLELAHTLAPHLKKVLNLSGKERKRPIENIDHLWAIDVQISNVTKAMVHRAHDKGLHVMTYTCNTPRQTDKALRMGIDGIISDSPAWLTRYLGRR